MTFCSHASGGVCCRRHVVQSFAVTLASMFALLWLAFHVLHAAAAEPSDKPASGAKAASPPAPVPLGEFSVQAEAATVNLREIATVVATSEPITLIARELPMLTREIEGRSRESSRILPQRPSLELLRNLERNWQTVRATLAAWTQELDARTAALDRDLARLAELEKIWRETHANAQKEQAPRELSARVETLLASIASTRTAVEEQRALALRLQSRVAAQEFRATEAIDAIRQARDASLARVFSRDAPPLWNGEALTQAGERIGVDSQETRETQWETLRNYAERRSDRIFLHSALFALLAALLYWARRRLMAWVETDPGLQHAATVVAYPIASALVLALIISLWVYPQAPRLMWAIIGAAALIPTVLVLRKLAEPYLRPLLYAVVAFFFIDQIRIVTASIELVPRLIFFAEALGGTAFLVWFLKRTTLPNAPPGGPRVHSKMVRLGVQLGCAVFAATAIANAAGYIVLANLIGNAALRSMYLGLVLYAVIEIFDALIEMALRVRPLTLFGMVRRHRELLRRRTRKVLNAAAIVWWLLFVLERLSVRDRVVWGAHDILSAELEIGAISISMSDVLAFVLAVWASFLVSRLVRFVLDEEVYPHARLTRGLPYAISRTLHYTILVAGFFLAMGVIGVDMTKFTILAGAFTVGVGFGLQNIFNNFVSGLILLFERPVQVGDVIQMDDAAGVVERIGIRATIVRTTSGSEVIVPNGKLISERLINWTFSQRQRGFEVAVSVVLGSDPQRVIGILERVAAAHQTILKQPAPEALLIRVGPDWMGFELRAATDQVEDWMRARSELAVAVTAALAEEKIVLR